MSQTQLEFGSAVGSSRPFHVPPGDWARPGLVERAFVARSVAEFRKDPNARYTWRKLTAEESLREDMAERLESIRAIDRLYGDELNEWAATTREQLWLEFFTAEAILRELEFKLQLVPSRRSTSGV